MLIEYSSVFNPQNVIEIKDLGYCAIEGSNDDGLYFYLIVVTVRGVSYIATCGPVIPDLVDLPPGYTSDLQVVKYTPKKIRTTIFSWLNGKKPGKSKSISSAKIICIEDALSQFRNVGEYFYDNIDLAARISAVTEEKSDG